ncbi:hypothetical protein pdam_00009638 [Pocillopora damicornis]|uniref:Uncharacterized protein n=1 Tax=Pocillopora damicornis TaxID=46731 RepID=A0A3M6U0F5_POCDA|nr:hypothetical protein pdam_00009638 [Pocillopora damicornis]
MLFKRKRKDKRAYSYHESTILRKRIHHVKDYTLNLTYTSQFCYKGEQYQGQHKASYTCISLDLHIAVLKIWTQQRFESFWMRICINFKLGATLHYIYTLEAGYLYNVQFSLEIMDANECRHFAMP